MKGCIKTGLECIQIWNIGSGFRLKVRIKDGIRKCTQRGENTNTTRYTDSEEIA